jgi:hypothetical protein
MRIGAKPKILYATRLPTLQNESSYPALYAPIMQQLLLVISKEDFEELD